MDEAPAAVAGPLARVRSLVAILEAETAHSPALTMARQALAGLETLGQEMTGLLACQRGIRLYLGWILAAPSRK